MNGSSAEIGEVDQGISLQLPVPYPVQGIWRRLNWYDVQSIDNVISMCTRVARRHR